MLLFENDELYEAGRRKSGNSIVAKGKNGKTFTTCVS